MMANFLFGGFVLQVVMAILWFRLGHRSGRRKQVRQGVSTSLLDYPEYWTIEQRRALWFVHQLTVQAWRRGRGYAQAHQSNNFLLDESQVVQVAQHAVRQVNPLDLPPGWSPKRAQECWMAIFIQAYQSK
jgi:hypothetical protein